MPRYLRSDATLLSSEAIREIIDARGTKNALSILAKKYKISNNRIYKIWRGQEHPMDPTVNINQNISISERDSSFQGSMSENLTVGKKKPNTEDLIDLCSEIPINNTIALNEIEKSPDIMPPHSQIKSHNIHLSTETQKMISFYCTA